MRRRLVPALAIGAALVAVPAGAQAQMSLLGVPLTAEGVRQLALETAVGAAYITCANAPRYQSAGGFRTVVESDGVKIEVCRTTTTTSPTSFSNEVEVVRATGLLPATLTFYVEGDNFQRETFKSSIRTSLLGSGFVVQ